MIDETYANISDKDLLKVVGRDKYSGFINQINLANAVVGTKLLTISTPNKRRGDTETRDVVLFCTDKVRSYLTEQLKKPKTNKKLIKERLTALDELAI